MEKISGTLTGVSMISGGLSSINDISGAITAPDRIVPDTYAGDYEFIPTEETQEITIEGKIASRNIVIDAIPENYGRLIWEGNRLTVY